MRGVATTSPRRGKPQSPEEWPRADRRRVGEEPAQRRARAPLETRKPRSGHFQRLRRTTQGSSLIGRPIIKYECFHPAFPYAQVAH